MKKLTFVASLFSFYLLFSGLAIAYEFSADTILTSEGQKVTGKIFSKGDKSRMEMNAQGHQMIMISRMDKKVAWNIMPAQKMYMEMPICFLYGIPFAGRRGTLLYVPVRRPQGTAIGEIHL